MDIREDDRAQSVMVGAVLLFGMVIVSFSLYQATVVPDQNREVEFNDYLEASTDLTELRNALLDAASSDTQRGVTVKTGTRYPARAVFVNPGPATGTVRTGPAENVTLWNVEAVSDHENVGRYVDSEGNALSVPTRALAFEPQYNQLDATEVRLANGLVYRNASRPVALSTQPIVKGNRITILSVAGELEANGHSTDLTVEPISAYSRTIGVRNESADPVTLTIPSRISATRWEAIFESQDDTGHVESVSPGPRPNTVNITLEKSTHYELRIAQLEVRQRDDTPDVTPSTPRYVVGQQEGILEEGDDGRVKLTVEARDRFNNARSNANLTFNASDGVFEDRDGDVLGSSSATVKTSADGRAVIWYNASKFGLQTVDVYLGDEVDDSLSAEQTLTYRVRTSGTGGAPSGDGADGGLFLYLEDVSITPKSNDIVWTLNNTGSSLNATGIQLGFVTEYRKAGGGKNGSGNTFADGPDEITNLTIDGTHRSVSAPERLRPDFSFDPVAVESGNNTVVTSFDQEVATSKQNTVFVRYHLFFEGGISATFDQVVVVK